MPPKSYTNKPTFTDVHQTPMNTYHALANNRGMSPNWLRFASKLNPLLQLPKHDVSIYQAQCGMSKPFGGSSNNTKTQFLP